MLCALAAGLLGASGCASSGWMARLSDDELPLEQQTTPYPTAVGRSIPPAASHDATATVEATQASDTPSQTQPPAKKVLDPIPVQTPPVAPLAMVPSALRMNRTPEPIPVEVPASQTAAAQQTEASQPEAAAQQHVERPVMDPAMTNASDSLPPIVSPSDARPAFAQAQAAGFGSAGASPSQALPTQAPPPTQTLSLQLPEDRLQAISQQRDVLMAMLEDEVRQRAGAGMPDPQLPRLEQELRLLYVAGQRVDDAARAIDSLSDAEREAYRNLMFGLSTWLTADEARRAPLRNARVMRSLRDAASELAAASKLDLRNLAFCERVQSYGWFTEFSRNEFLPKQQVILYVEVDNFAAVEKSPTSFETELQGHYQIFDSRGNIVAERKLPLDREVCRNYRRDYFLAYPIYLPEAIEPGHYRLELTIEDLKATGEYQGRKFGEGMIDFAIRG